MQSKIVERIQASAFLEGRKHIIYLGDGKGDYCPSLGLSEEDYVMPRKNYPLWELINENPKAVRAEIHEWSNAVDLERVLFQLIHDHSVASNRSNTNQLISNDCKFQIIPLSSHEALPKSLPVPN